MRRKHYRQRLPPVADQPLTFWCYSGNGGGDPGGINVDARLQQHDRLIEWQDEQLDDLVVSVAKVGQMGRTIGEELGSQAEMLNELDGHLDSTGARVRAASRKIEKRIRGSKGCQSFPHASTALVCPRCTRMWGAAGSRS